MEKLKQSISIALDCAVNEGRMGQTWADAVMLELDQLVADAQRFNGVRMILCEPDKAKRERMCEALVASIERLTESFNDETIVTPEMVNAIADAALLAACEARK